MDQNTHPSTFPETKPKSNDESPIFVIGGGRSGTTLMRYMLNAHPNIYLLEEVSTYTWTRGKAGRNLNKRMERFFNSFSFAWLRIPVDTVKKAVGECNSEEKIQRLILQTMKTKAATLGRTRFGEKNPVNIYYLEKIFQHFPDARVIHVVRDPRAQVYSHLTMPFSTPSLLIANLGMKKNFSELASFSDRMITIKLEELVKTPEPIMRSVLDFIGEPWSENVLNHHEHVIDNDGIPLPWLTEAGGARKYKKLKWTDQLSPDWIRLTEHWQRDALKTYGYSRAELPAEPGNTSKLWAIVSDIPFLLRSLISFAWAFVLIRLTNPKAGRLQKILTGLNPRAWKYHPEWSRQLPNPPDIQ